MYNSPKHHLHKASCAHHPKQSPFPSPFPHLCPPLPIATPPFLWLSPNCCLCLCDIYVFLKCLIHLTFSTNPQYHFPLTAVSLCHVPMPLFLLCSSVYFVHYIPHRSEIIWYSYFSDWLTSLSIIISRSIHVVAKDKIYFFFWPSSIPLCKRTTVVFFLRRYLFYF